MPKEERVKVPGGYDFVKVGLDFLTSVHHPLDIQHFLLLVSWVFRWWWLLVLLLLFFFFVRWSYLLYVVSLSVVGGGWVGRLS